MNKKSGMEPGRATKPGTLCGLALALCMLAGPSRAQEQGAAAPAPPPADSADADVQEIVVTAQKRSENVQDIPKAVEVISQGALQQAGVNGLQDLGLISPSIQGASAAGSPPAIRGISSFAYSIGVQAQTGVVLDDVPQPNFSTLADELTDVERVEVLPGPQSTLSGRNAAGGLINIVTRSPTRDLRASATSEWTEDHQHRLAGYVTGPLGNQLAFSLSGFLNDWDGPLHNVATGHRQGGFDRSGGRVKLQYQPLDGLTATLSGYYTHNSARTAALVGGYSYVELGDAVQSYFIPGVPLKSLLSGVTVGPYNRDIYSAYEGRLNSHDEGGALRLEYETKLGTLSSISNFSRSVTDTGTPLVGFTLYPDLNVAQSYTVTYKTQELRLASPASNDRFQYLFGLIYSDTAIDEPYERPVIAPVDWDRSSSLKSVALYTHDSYRILPKTWLTAGLRLQHDEQSYNWVFLDGTAPTSSGSSTYNFPAGEVSLRQEFASDISGYLTYSNAQTGEAYDLENEPAAVSAQGLQPLDSEKVQNYEAGFKTRWLDHRLTLNASVFDAHYKSYQIQQAYLAPGASLPSIQLLSIGKVESRGVEVDGSFAATHNLKLNLGLTYLDAKITDYPNAICYPNETTASCTSSYPGTQGNLSGTAMPGASKFKGIAALDYTIGLPALPVAATFNALYRYQSSMHTNVLGDPASHIDGYGTLNLASGLRYDTHNGARFALQLFVNNVFDTKYYTSREQDSVVFDPTGTSNPPAVYANYARDSFRYEGVRLSVDY